MNKPGVSELHIRLEEREGEYSVTDLNSTNGTYVNNVLLGVNETAVIAIGDEIGIGTERYQLC